MLRVLASYVAAAVLPLAAAVAPVPAPTPDPLARFASVAVKPATTSIILGSVTMTISPFQRGRDLYQASYYAKVFPYFFYSERGRIWITVTDDDLRRAARGESITYKGRAVNEDGESRRIEGAATPTGPTTGRLRVRVFVTRHISLTYDTTYELTGAGAPAVTAR